MRAQGAEPPAMRENATLLLQPSFYPIRPDQDFSLAPSQSTFKGLEVLAPFIFQLTLISRRNKRLTPKLRFFLVLEFIRKDFIQRSVNYFGPLMKGAEVLISYANIVLPGIPSIYCCITSGPCLARLLQQGVSS